MRWIAVPAAFVVAAMTAPAASQEPVRSTFVTMKGKDTSLVETFVRSPDAIIGEMWLMLPGKSHVSYTVFLNPDGTADRVVFREETPGNVMQLSTTFGADSIRGIGSQRGKPIGGAVAVTGKVYAYIGISYPLLESLVRALHPAVGATARFSVFNIRVASGVAPFMIRRISADSVVIGGVRAAIAPNGDLTGGRNDQTNEVTIRRN